MVGYYKNQEATEEVFTQDGWLRTGDLGSMDNSGNIFIRGRLKTMILSSSGQNIFPEELETKLNNLPFILESLVIERKHTYKTPFFSVDTIISKFFVFVKL